MKSLSILVLSANLTDNRGKPFGKVTVMRDDRPHDGLDMVFYGPFVKVCGTLPVAVPCAVFCLFEAKRQTFLAKQQIFVAKHSLPRNPRECALELAPVLQQELLDFRYKLDPATAHESFAAWREKDHDDLVLYVALAVWWGEKQAHERPPQVDMSRGLVRKPRMQDSAPRLGRDTWKDEILIDLEGDARG